MKKLTIVFIITMMAGCAGMGGRGGYGASSGSSDPYGGGSQFAPGQGSSVFDRFDPSFNPYFGG
jgi:hypothetical protein